MSKLPYDPNSSELNSWLWGCSYIALALRSKQIDANICSSQFLQYPKWKTCSTQFLQYPKWLTHVDRVDPNGASWMICMCLDKREVWEVWKKYGNLYSSQQSSNFTSNMLFRLPNVFSKVPFLEKDLSVSPRKKSFYELVFSHLRKEGWLCGVQNDNLLATVTSQ